MTTTNNEIVVNVRRNDNEVLFEFKSPDAFISLGTTPDETVRLCRKALQIALDIDVELSYLADKEKRLKCPSKNAII